MILGLNAYHGDASAVLLSEVGIECAAEEERFSRLKHTAGFPSLAARACLAHAGVKLPDVEHVAISRNPMAHIHRKVLFALSRRHDLHAVGDRLSNMFRIREIAARLAEAFDAPESAVRARMHRVEHHRAHMASSFFVSPFERAALMSIDGFGDFVSTMWGRGFDNRIEVDGRVEFPHSMGLLYTAVTQYLGFPKYGDEFKVMGLASYGEPEYVDAIRPLARRDAGGFVLDLDYFVHHSQGVSMTWEKGAPTLGDVFSGELVRLLGPRRQPGDPIERRHENIAASLQAILEEIVLDMLRELARHTGLKDLCLAGGVALNCTMNGKIVQETPFERVYIQPAAYDAGTGLGAALYVKHEVLEKPRDLVMDHCYWGLEYSNRACRDALEQAGLAYEELPEDVLVEKAAAQVADGRILGWYQGRFEWGPRALGNRSIVCDARNPGMKDILNHRIKHRESFRPFAPSVTAEDASTYFELDGPSPFMLLTCRVHPAQRDTIPAITHVDGTARVQTVDCATNPRYWKLLKAFQRRTGVAVVLNTSFNENEPIVNTPKEAIDCFRRNDMDVLVLGTYLVLRKTGQ